MWHDIDRLVVQRGASESVSKMWGHGLRLTDLEIRMAGAMPRGGEELCEQRRRAEPRVRHCHVNWLASTDGVG